MSRAEPQAKAIEQWRLNGARVALILRELHDVVTAAEVHRCDTTVKFPGMRLPHLAYLPDCEWKKGAEDVERLVSLPSARFTKPR